MFYCENTKEYVFKQGDKASSYFLIGYFFYIVLNSILNNNFIDTGECEIYIDNVLKKTLK
jgi:hypothetical protein